MMKKTILAIVLIVLVVMSVRMIKTSGLFTTIEPIPLANCQPVTGPIGAEDITIDAVNRLAYIGADNRAAYLIDGAPTPINGGIWLLDLSQPDSLAVRLETGITGPFHPHGIALRNNERGEAIELYVVNHPDSYQHEIVIFDIPAPGVLKLRRRVSYPEMISPNDLVVVGKDQFYVTNDHGSAHDSFMQKVEDYLALPFSSVSYFDGVKGHIVIDGLKMANGIAIAEDHQTLYVAETLGRQIIRYKRGESPLAWHYQDSVAIGNGVDNLEWDGKGALLTAGHPKLFDFLAHLNNPEKPAASEVVRIDVSGEKMQAETLYRNNGEEISGSSVAAQLGETMLIGPVIDDHFIRCDIDS